MLDESNIVPLRIMVVIGTRPEAIKLAPLILEILSSPHLEVFVCVTGQHDELLSGVLERFGIKAGINLRLMVPNQDLARFSSRCIESLSQVMTAEDPDLVIVHGDTLTALCAALVAFWQRRQIGHIEAGLRSRDLENPWPEECNRRSIAVMANLHFAPTVKAELNLINEGVDPGSITVTGNTVLDALRLVTDDLNDAGDAEFEDRALQEFVQRPFILVTIHRRESFGVGIRQVCEGLKFLASEEDHRFLVFVHPNPNISSVISGEFDGVANVRLQPPTDYINFVKLMTMCTFIISDSGGIQEEAVFLKKIVLVLRRVTERPEGIEAGFLRLIGTDAELLKKSVLELSQQDLHTVGCGACPFGDGYASHRIVDRLVTVADYRKRISSD